MGKFQQLQSTFQGLMQKEEEFWDDLYSAALILTREFAVYIQAPFKDCDDGSLESEVIAVGKFDGGKFVNCGFEGIGRGHRSIEFYIVLFLDQETRETPPNQLSVRLRLTRNGDDYKVVVGSDQIVRIIEGDFTILNDAIFEAFNAGLEPIFADIE